MVSLLGSEGPGLTSSLAIDETVVAELCNNKLYFPFSITPGHPSEGAGMPEHLIFGRG